MKHALSDLITFQAIADDGGITAAARSLGVSKSTVSNRLIRLESEMELKLIQRSTRRLRLTEAGQRLLVHCRRISEEVEQANLTMEAFQHTFSGRITIASPIASGHVFIPDLLAGFRSQYPGVDFTVELSDDGVDMIHSGIDVAFRTGEQQDSNLIARRLMDFSIRLYASPQLVKSMPLPQKPQDLGHFDCLFHPAIPVWNLHRGSTRYVFRPPQNIVAEDFTFLRRLLLQDRAITALPSYLAKPDVKSGRLIEVLPDWDMKQMPYSLVYASKRHSSQAISKFIEFTVQYFRQKAF